MADRIKGITVEIGGDTTGLSKALSSTNKQISTTQGQLKDVERLLKLDPTNTQLLEQRQRLLADAVGQTSAKLDALKEAEKQVQQQFERGEVSREQYDALQREIAATEISLKNLEGKAAEAAAAISKVDEAPVEDVTSAAKKAGDALDDAGREASDFADYLSAGAIIEAAKGIASAIADISEETKEFRKIMASLDASSQKAGYTAEQTSESFYQLYFALGDDQSAATALANLQALGLEQGDLNELIKQAVGAWATYGDSIPIDGLAESINETIRCGQVTGTFADVLNWGSKEGETFGVMLRENTEANKEWNEAVMDAKTAEDFFNLALEDAETQAERTNIVMQALANQGLADTADAWVKNNQDLVDANDAQLDFMNSAAELSKRVDPALTSIKEGGTQLLNTFLGLTEEVDFEALGDDIDAVFDAVSNIITFLVDNGEVTISVLLGIAAGLAAMKLTSLIGTLTSIASGATTAAAAFPQLSAAIGLLTNPIFLVTAAVVGAVALIATKGDEIQALLQKLDDFLQGIFLKDWTEVFGPGVGDALNAFFATAKTVWDGVKGILDGIIDFIRGVFTGDWERAWNGVKSIFKGVFDALGGIVKAPLNLVIGLLNGAIGGINSLLSGLNKIRFDVPDWVPLLGGKSWGINIGMIPKIPYLAKGGVLSQGSAIVGEAGPELLTMSGNRAVVQPLSSSNVTHNLGGVNITVYGAPGQDVRELASIVMDEIQSATERRGAVFA